MNLPKLELGLEWTPYFGVEGAGWVIQKRRKIPMTDAKTTTPNLPTFESYKSSGSPATLLHINDTIEPAVLVDVDGRVLAKCPQCEREYHLIEHGECTDELVRKLALAAIEHAKEYIIQMTTLHIYHNRQ